LSILLVLVSACAKTSPKATARVPLDSGAGPTDSRGVDEDAGWGTECDAMAGGAEDAGPLDATDAGQCPATYADPGSSCQTIGLRCTYDNVSVVERCVAVRCSNKGFWQQARPPAGTPCPKQVPLPDTPCPAAQRCSYESTRLGCGTRPHVDAECDANSLWQLWQPVTCGALEAPACNPAGTWELAFHFHDQDAGFPDCAPPDKTETLVVRRRSTGELQLLQATGDISADGCHLQARFAPQLLGAGGPADAVDTLDLMLHDGTATGSVDHTTTGSCPGHQHSTAAGARTP
jgi:hypothetical protein